MGATSHFISPCHALLRCEWIPYPHTVGWRRIMGEGAVGKSRRVGYDSWVLPPFCEGFGSGSFLGSGVCVSMYVDIINHDPPKPQEDGLRLASGKSRTMPFFRDMGCWRGREKVKTKNITQKMAGRKYRRPLPRRETDKTFVRNRPPRMSKSIILALSVPECPHQSANEVGPTNLRRNSRTYFGGLLC